MRTRLGIKSKQRVPPNRLEKESKYSIPLSSSYSDNSKLVKD